MNDLISKQDAIEALKKIMFTHLFECGEYIGEDTREVSIMNAEKALDAIENLPSAEPERKKGYWVPVTNGRGGFECDQCHNYAPSYQNGDEYLSYYCPNCGADMRGEI